MMTRVSERRATRLCRYPIASAEMYYYEVEQRDVRVCDDPEKGFRIWGEIPDVGATTAIGLCEVFLEYAMYSQTWRDLSQAYHNMQAFGEQLGEALARYIKDNAPAEMTANLGACALECVLESMNAHFTVEQVGSELRFIVVGCPLRETAELTSLMEVQLAHHGINALCQSLIHALSPDLVVRAPLEVRVDHIFSVMTPVYA
jgi:hypothetical protein